MKPNIVLINCDDLGYGDLGCYGSKINSTPFIDSLASEGVKFNSFYASSSVCTPSRAALMTGCYAQRVDMPLVLFPAAKTGLNKNEFTMPKMFKNAGYNTMIIGKWHCGDNPETLPCKFGFDDYYGIPYSNDMGRQANGFNGKDKDGNPIPLPPLPLIHGDEIIQQQPDQTGITERYTEKSVEFIRKSVKEENPFFLYLAHMHVHLPLYEQERFLRESQNGDFGACVASLDWSTHVIVDELKRQGIYEDTMIIFTSDNGSRGDHGASNAPLRGAKFKFYEGGYRVPFIVHWKGHIKEGTEIENLAVNMDLLPTFASILGEKLSDNIIDGVDVSPMLMGEDVKIRDEFAYYSNYDLCAIRKGQYKLILATDPEMPWKDTRLSLDKPILFDLANDIGETCDVADEHPDVVKEILGLTGKYRTAIGDTLTNCIGNEVRQSTQIKNPVTMTEYDENHPYIISMYDKDDRG